MGYEKIILILTQPLNYRKNSLDKNKEKLIEKKFKKYPKLINTMKNRHNNYNSTIEKIIDMENEKEIFVIRPSKKIDINLIERDSNKLQEVYDLGVSDCKKNLKKLKEYLR